MLAFEGVTRVFRDAGARHAALDDVTFRLDAGGLTAVVGENGAGKTTLLRLAAGLDRPTRGRVVVDGDPSRAPRVGYLAQDAGLYDALTLRENLVFFANAWGRGGEVDAVAARLGLAPRLGTPARRLSRGERQRGALARALLGGDLVLLDEPTTALDADGRARLLAALDAERGRRTVLVATHDDALAAKCDRVLRLQGGRLA